MEEQLPKLVLVFDVNRTLIMTDKATGKSLQSILGQIIAEKAWGLVEEKDNNGSIEYKWKLTHEELSVSRPDPSLISYEEFVKKYYSLNGKASAGMTKEQIIAKKAELFDSFTKPGNSGAKFRKLLERMEKALELPKIVKSHLGIQEGEAPKESKDTDDLESLLSKGKYHIIPSFYKLILNLKKLKREYSVMFRSFGDDTKNIILEFNKLCDGTHPCYNGSPGIPLVKFDGSKNNKDYRITKNKGILFRTPLMENTVMVVGTIERVFKLSA